MAADAAVSAISVERPPLPYPGLRPFESDEWQIFFGREPMIDEVIDRLALQRLVMIHGASGSGKSSLVRAGVLPKLARQHLRHGAPWLTCAMRPSGGPLWNLAAELAALEGRAGDFARIGELIRLCNRRGATLATVVASIEALAGRHLCILIDQFEELFRFEHETSRDEAELFVDLLIGDIPDPEAEDTAAPSALHVIVTMRSEFLGECARFGGFAEAINRTQYLVPRLSRAALVRAIQQPARLYGGEVTGELCERLLTEMRGKLDELSLIQHGLMRFWREASTKADGGRPVLGVAMLDRAGGLAALLSDHADSVAAAVAPTAPRRKAVEQLFRALSDINADGQGIRRPQAFGDLVAVCGVPEADLREIVEAFRAEGVSFLTPYAPAAITEETVIDISHEALIRGWSALSDSRTGWLRREFGDGLIWRSVLLEARDFERDRRRLLSAQTTIDRSRWLKHQTERWSQRYGGGWGAVAALMKQSERVRRRGHRYRRVGVLMLALIGLLGAALVGQSLVGAGRRPSVLLVLSTTVFGLWIQGYLLVTIAQILIGLIPSGGLSGLRRALPQEALQPDRAGSNKVSGAGAASRQASRFAELARRYRYRGYVLPFCLTCSQLTVLGSIEGIESPPQSSTILMIVVAASVVANVGWIGVSLFWRRARND
jgi:hypothetical protein